MVTLPPTWTRTCAWAVSGMAMAAAEATAATARTREIRMVVAFSMLRASFSHNWRLVNDSKFAGLQRAHPGVETPVHASTVTGIHGWVPGEGRGSRSR